jgi:hypothetical protein
MSRAGVSAVLAVVVCAAVGVLAGCGADDAAAPEAAPQTVTVTRQSTSAAPAQTSTVAPPAPTAADSSPPPAAVDPPDAGGIVVPDVVGENHQDAQDTMQDAGLYNLAEQDATGQGRLLLWDRNWVVVSQSPPAGSRVNDGAAIVLSSRKYSD